MSITQLKTKLKKQKEAQITTYQNLFRACLLAGDLKEARRYNNLSKRLRKQIEV
jgi:hypothetical protein